MLTIRLLGDREGGGATPWEDKAAYERYSPVLLSSLGLTADGVEQLLPG